MNYGRVTRWYEVCEWLVFGGRLQWVREAFLGEIRNRVGGGGRVLLVGDGDGRFLEKLIEVLPGVAVDSVDSCEEMVELARGRVRGGAESVEWRVMDFEEFGGGGYDAVFAHFFLDGFDGGDLDRVVNRLCGCVADCGVLVVSDFDREMCWWSRGWVKVMQVFFWLFAGLGFRDFKRCDGLFGERGFVKSREVVRVGGFIYGELWEKREKSVLQ